MKLSEQLDRIEEAVDSIRTTFDLEEAVIEDVAIGTADKINELNATVATKEETITEKNNEIVSLNETIANKNTDIAELNEALDEKENNINILNAEIESKDASISSLQTQVSELESQLPSGEVTLEANGTYNVSAYVNAIVNVPDTGATEPNLGQIHITENGIYNAVDSNFDGFSTVNVEVETSSGPVELADIYLVGTEEELNELPTEDGSFALVARNDEIAIDFMFTEGNITLRDEIVFDTPITSQNRLYIRSDSANITVNITATVLNLSYSDEESSSTVRYRSTDGLTYTYYSGTPKLYTFVDAYVYGSPMEIVESIDKIFIGVDKYFGGIYECANGIWDTYNIGSMVSPEQLFIGNKVYTDNGFVEGAFNLSDYQKYNIFTGSAAPADLTDENKAKMSSGSLYVRRTSGNFARLTDSVAVEEKPTLVPSLRTLQNLEVEPYATFKDGSYVLILGETSSGYTVSCINLATEEYFTLLSVTTGRFAGMDVDTVNKKFYLEFHSANEIICDIRIYDYNLEAKTCSQCGSITNVPVCHGVLVYPAANILYIYGEYDDTLKGDVYYKYNLSTGTYTTAAIPSSLRYSFLMGCRGKNVLSDRYVTIRYNSTFKIDLEDLSQFKVIKTAGSASGNIVFGILNQDNRFITGGSSLLNCYEYDESTDLAYFCGANDAPTKLSTNFTVIAEYENKIFGYIYGTYQLAVITNYEFNLIGNSYDNVLVLYTSKDGRVVKLGNQRTECLKIADVAYPRNGSTVIELYYYDGSTFSKIIDKNS